MYERGRKRNPFGSNRSSMYDDDFGGPSRGSRLGGKQKEITYDGSEPALKYKVCPDEKFDMSKSPESLVGVPNKLSKITEKNSIISTKLWNTPFEGQEKSTDTHKITLKDGNAYDIIKLKAEELKSKALFQKREREVLNNFQKEKNVMEEDLNKKLERIEELKLSLSKYIATEKVNFEKEINEEVINREKEILGKKLKIEKEFKEDKERQLAILEKLDNDITTITDNIGITPQELNFQPPTFNIIENYNFGNVTVEQLDSMGRTLIKNIVEELSYTAENNEAMFNKIEDASEKKIVGATAVATLGTVLAPVSLVTAAFYAGKKMADAVKSRGIIVETVRKLYETKYLLRILYPHISELPQPDTQYLLDELDRYNKEVLSSKERFEEKYKREIKDKEEEIKREEDRRYKEKYIDNKEGLLEGTLKQQTKLIEELDSELKKLNEKITDKENSFKELNTEPLYKNKFVEDSFDKIADTKKKMQDFIDYKDYSTMKINPIKDNEVIEDELEFKRRTYDKEVQNLTAKLEYILDIHTTLEEFQDDLDKIMRDEDKLYILDTSKIVLGELITNKQTKLSIPEIAWGDGLNNNSILFVYRDDIEREAMINYIKYITQQILCQLHPKAVEVAIINPSVSTVFNDITINTDTEKDGEIVKNGNYVTSMSGQDLEEYKKYLKRTIEKRNKTDFAGGKNIYQIIKKKRLEGSLTPKFHINIVLDDENVSEIDKYQVDSNITGILNFRLIDINELIEIKTDKNTKIVEIKEDIRKKFSKVGTIVEAAAKISSKSKVSGEKNIMAYGLRISTKKDFKESFVLYSLKSQEEIEETTTYLKERYLNMASKQPPFSVSEFILQLTGGKYYTMTSESNLKFYPGRQDGDVSKMTPVILDGKAIPHRWNSGTTGGGKSVTLSAEVNVSKILYSPKELEVIYYDFKVVECMLHAFPYQWPNCSIISGAATPDYLISVLEDIDAQMKKRYEIFSEYQTNSYEDYRKSLTKKMKEAVEKADFVELRRLEKRWLPRLLVLIDEYTAGLDDDEGKAKMIEVTSSLLRLARAAGIHISAWSQAPPSSIMSLLDLIMVRGCTKASRDVSKVTFGNDFAARPEHQFLGFFGIAPKGGSNCTEEDMRMYVVPFSDKTDSWKYSKIANDLSDKLYPQYKRIATVFSDTEEMTYEDLNKFYKLNPEESKLTEIPIGDQVRYNPVYKPATIPLNFDSNENIIFISAVTQEKINFFKLLMRHAKEFNISMKMYFSKDIPDWFDISMASRPIFPDNPVFKLKRTGKVIEPYFFREDEMEAYKIKKMDFEKNVREGAEPDYTFDELCHIGTREEILKRGVLYIDNQSNFIDSKEVYTKPIGYNRSGTMMDRFRNELEGVLEGKKKRFSGVDRSEIPVNFFILWDPDLDQYLLEDRPFRNDTKLGNLLSESAEVGVYVFLITSDTSKLLYEPYRFRHIYGSKLSDAGPNNWFKKLPNNLMKYYDIKTPIESYKIKTAIDPADKTPLIDITLTEEDQKFIELYKENKELKY